MSKSDRVTPGQKGFNSAPGRDPNLPLDKAKAVRLYCHQEEWIKANDYNRSQFIREAVEAYIEHKFQTATFW